MDLSLGLNMSGGVLSNVAQIITAAVNPSMDIIASGQAVEDTTNYAAMIDPSNFTSAAGTISSVVVGFQGDATDATTPLWGDQTAGFTVTVTDSLSNQRVFTTNIITVPLTDMVMTIEVSASDTWTLPTSNLGVWNVDVDMDDGNGTQNVTTYNGISTTYASGGIKTIRMRGQADNINCSESPTDAAKIRTVENLGDLSWQRMIRGFQGASGMTSFTIGTSDMSAVNNMAEAFENCTALVTCDITGHPFAAVTNFRQAFRNCPALLTVPGFNDLNFGAVERADECFEGTLNVTGIDPSGFDILALTSDGGMFRFIEDTVALPQAVYDAVITNYAAQALDPGFTDLNVQLGFGISPFTTGGAVEADRVFLIGELGSLTDGGNDVPETMAAPSLVVDGSGQITVTRAAPPFSNGRPVTSYNLYQSTDGTNYSLAVTGMSTAQAVTGLLSETQYWFYTTAVNFDGEGPAGAAANATTDAAASLTIDSIGPQGSDGNVPTTYTIGADDPAVEHVLADATQPQPLASDFNGGGAPTYIDLGTVSLTTSGSNILAALPSGVDPNDGDVIVWFLPSGGGDADVVGSPAFTLDTKAPELASSVPADEATDIAVTSTITLTFDETIAAGTGTFTLRDVTNSLDTEVFTVGGSGSNGGTISVSGTDVTLTPGANMAGSTVFAIRWTAGAITDAFSNDVAANATDTLVNFTTVAAGLTNPNDLSPEAWFDMTDVSTLYQDTARTNPVTADGQVVRGIEDQSGNGRHGSTTDDFLTWNATDGQVEASIVSATQAIEIGTVSGIPANYELYVGLKTSGNRGALMGRSTSGFTLGRFLTSTGTTETNAGTPSYSVGTTDLGTTTRDVLHANWSTGAGVVAGAREVDPTNLNGSVGRFFNSNTNDQFAGSFTHIVLQGPLSASDRTDLQNWIDARKPV